MYRVVLYTDTEQVKYVLPTSIDLERVMQDNKLEEKELIETETEYYSYKDIIDLFGQRNGIAFYFLLRRDFDSRRKMMYAYRPGRNGKLRRVPIQCYAKEHVAEKIAECVERFTPEIYLKVLEGFNIDHKIEEKEIK